MPAGPGPAGAGDRPLQAVARRVRGGLVAGGLALGWTVVRALPERLAYALAARAADVAWLRRGAGVRRLEDNLARVVGPDPQQLRSVSRQGMRSYLRYWCDTFRLPDWSAERTVGAVRMVDEELLRTHLAQGRGVVGALPHLANWDHAGAWAGLTGAPVTTVAERLEPERLFDRFVAHRAALGMEVLPLTGGAPPADLLAARLAAGGFVPLLADRDLARRGVEVVFFGEPARFPPGPALLALRTGAAMLPVTLWYDGPHLVLRINEEVVPPPAGSVRERVATMTQQLADVFAAAIRAHPADWHMLQPLWERDLPPRVGR